MAFTANFTVSQSVTGTSLTINDTSSYSSEGKGTFTSRQLYLYKVDGTTVKFPSGSTTDYINFSFASYPSDSITITGFTQDLCLRIDLVLTPATPVGGSTYLKESIVTMVGFTNNQIYSACQILANNPARQNDLVFTANLLTLNREKNIAINAGTYSDQFSSQSALNRANNIILTSNIRF